MRRGETSLGTAPTHRLGDGRIRVSPRTRRIGGGVFGRADAARADGTVVPARMVSSSLDDRQRHVVSPPGELSHRTLSDLGCSGLTAGCARTRSADCAHDSASAAHVAGFASRADGRPRIGNRARPAAATCARGCSSVPAASRAADWKGSRQSCVVLACGDRGAGRMACPRRACARNAIARVARLPARVLSRSGASVLVARRTAVAECVGARMAPRALPVSCDASV